MTTNRAVSFSILVRAKPERVFDAIATAQGLDAWLTKCVSVEARPGGSVRFRWENWGPDSYTGENGGPVLEARRPERFVFRWKVVSGSYKTAVEINLQQREMGTVVRLVEHGCEDSPEGNAGHAESRLRVGRRPDVDEVLSGVRGQVLSGVALPGAALFGWLYQACGAPQRAWCSSRRSHRRAATAVPHALPTH